MEANEYYVKYPVIQVRPYGLLVYDHYEWFRTPRKKEKNQSNTIQDDTTGKIKGLARAYTGQITPYSKKKLKRAIQLMVASAKEKEAPNWKTGKTYKFKVNFITLTLPAPQGEVTDKQIKAQCLDNFIKRLKRNFKLGSYVWRAERQKNGNLHFHIITDTWIHYERIRNHWNDCLQKLGFIDKFESKHGHRNPNSTDIHAVWKVKNLTQYFIKYMSKGSQCAEDLYRIPFQRKRWHEKLIIKPTNEFKRVMTREENKIEGKIWDCSQNLKNRKNCELVLEDEQLEIFNEAIADATVEVKQEQNFCILFLNPQQFKQYIRGILLTRWIEYLAMIRGDSEPEQTASTHDHSTLRAA